MSDTHETPRDNRSFLDKLTERVKGLFGQRRIKIITSKIKYMSSNNNFGITFDLPKNQSNIIKVIGVGGGEAMRLTTCLNKASKGSIL